jgi:uncharacterized protein YjbI with pentapeptide repeats
VVGRSAQVRVIGAHLQAGVAVSWQGLDLDFTGVIFDGGDFSGAVFSGGTVSFQDPQDWTHPPNFGFADAVPAGVTLPARPTT